MSAPRPDPRNSTRTVAERLDQAEEAGRRWGFEHVFIDERTDREGAESWNSIMEPLAKWLRVAWAKGRATGREQFRAHVISVTKGPQS